MICQECVGFAGPFRDVFVYGHHRACTKFEAARAAKVGEIIALDQDAHDHVGVVIEGLILSRAEVAILATKLSHAYARIASQSDQLAMNAMRASGSMSGVTPPDGGVTGPDGGETCP